MRVRLLELRFIHTTRPRVRVGVIVPRFSNSAVDRNRVKRRLREIIRSELLRAPVSAMDIAVRASPLAYAASFEELRGAVVAASRRLPGCSR